MPLGFLAKTLITTGAKAAVSGVGYAIKNNSNNSASTSSSLYRRVEVNTHIYRVDSKKQDDKNLKSCLSFFEEAMQMFLASLDRISCGYQGKGNRVKELSNVSEILVALDCIAVFTVDVDKLKSISKESFECAKASFKAARDDATRAFSNEALNSDDRLLAAQVRKTNLKLKTNENSTEIRRFQEGPNFVTKGLKRRNFVYLF